MMQAHHQRRPLPLLRSRSLFLALVSFLITVARGSTPQYFGYYGAEVSDLAANGSDLADHINVIQVRTGVYYTAARDLICRLATTA